MKRTELRRTGRIKRRSKPRPTALEIQLQEAWDAGSQQDVCAVTGRPASRDDPIESHHVVTKERLKKVASSLGLSRDDRAQLLWDPRNRMRVLRSIHDMHTRAQRRIPRSKVSPEALEFAAELDLERDIEAYYPA